MKISGGSVPSAMFSVSVQDHEDSGKHVQSYPALPTDILYSE